MRSINGKKSHTPVPQKPSVLIPDQILRQMRLNKNFANVYTPFHEFQEPEQDNLEVKKSKRKQRFRMLIQKMEMQNQAQQQNQEQEVVQANDKAATQRKSLSTHKGKNDMEAHTVGSPPQRDLRKMKNNPTETKFQRQGQIKQFAQKNKIDTITVKPQFLNNKKGQQNNRQIPKNNEVTEFAAPAQEANLKGSAAPYLDKKRLSKPRADHANADKQVAKSEEKFKVKVKNDNQGKFYFEEKQQPGANQANTQQSFSKQERKKNRIGYGLGQSRRIGGSNSSQAEHIKTINKVSSLASLPHRAPSIPDQHQFGRDSNQYQDRDYQHGMRQKKTVQSLGKLNTKSAVRRLDARQQQVNMQRNISNDDGDKSGGMLRLEFSEGSVENLSLKRQAVMKRNVNNSRLNMYRGSNKSNASPLAGNIYFPDRLRATLNGHIQPIQDINYKRNYRQDAALNGDSRNSLHVSQRKLTSKKLLRVGETNLTFFNGSLKRPSQQSEPLDLDLTFLESYYDKYEKITVERLPPEGEQPKKLASGALVPPNMNQNLYLKKRTQQMDKKNDLDHHSGSNFNSMIISGRYIDCGSQRRQRDKRNKQVSQEMINRPGNHYREKDDDSLLSKEHKGPNQAKSASRSPPQLQQNRNQSKVRFDSPFIGLSDLGNTYYPNIVNVQNIGTYHRSSQVSNKNNKTLSLFPQTSSTGKLVAGTNQTTERKSKQRLTNQLYIKKSHYGQITNGNQDKSGAGVVRQKTIGDPRSVEGSAALDAVSSGIQITEIDSPEADKQPKSTKRGSNAIAASQNHRSKRPNNIRQQQAKANNIKNDLRMIVTNETLSIGSNKSLHSKGKQHHKFAQRRESNNSVHSNEVQAINLKQMKPKYKNQGASCQSSKQDQTYYNQPVILSTNYEYIYPKTLIQGNMAQRGKLTFNNNSRKNINVQVKQGAPTQQGTPKRKSEAGTNFVNKNKLYIRREPKASNIIKSLPENKFEYPMEHQQHRDSWMIGSNLYYQEHGSTKNEKRFLSAQKLQDAQVLDIKDQAKSVTKQNQVLLPGSALSKGDKFALNRMTGDKTKSWNQQNQNQAMTKQQSMLPMINGKTQKQANAITLRPKQLRQPPALNNGVSNNLYLGAANLSSIGNSSIKKSTPGENNMLMTQPELHHSPADDNIDVTSKNTISFNKHTISGTRKNDKARADVNFQNNIVLHEKYEYCSSGKKNNMNGGMNSKTQMMFQGRGPSQRQPTNKARPKRQKTLPDNIYLQRNVKDHSVIMTSSLATMRQSSNLSVRDDAQNNQEDLKERNNHIKRNKQYLYQMYRSNDEANDGQTRRGNQQANMSIKQRNVDNVIAGQKQEWKRTAGSNAGLKNKFTKDRIYLPQQMPDIMAANEQASAGIIDPPLDRRNLKHKFTQMDFAKYNDREERKTQQTIGKNPEKIIVGHAHHNRTSMQNYKQSRMYFYNNHLRDTAEVTTGPPMTHVEKSGGDLNSSLNLPSNTRTQADNFISGQNNNHQNTLTQTERTQPWNNNANNKIGSKYQQVLGRARQSKDGPNKQQQPSNPVHRQQRSQLGMHSFIGQNQNQIYYNDNLRDQKHMSLPYLNEHKSRQSQGLAAHGTQYMNSHDSKRKFAESDLLGSEANGPDPELHTRTLKRMKDHPASTHRTNRAAEAAYADNRQHSEQINRIHSEGSTVSEIHHHHHHHVVHHNYNHTYVQHHHHHVAAPGSSVGANAVQTAPFNSNGTGAGSATAAVPSANQNISQTQSYKKMAANNTKN